MMARKGRPEEIAVAAAVLGDAYSACDLVVARDADPQSIGGCSGDVDLGIARRVGQRDFRGAGGDAHVAKFVEVHGFDSSANAG